MGMLLSETMPQSPSWAVVRVMARTSGTRVPGWGDWTCHFVPHLVPTSESVWTPVCAHVCWAAFGTTRAGKACGCRAHGGSVCVRGGPGHALCVPVWGSAECGPRRALVSWTCLHMADPGRHTVGSALRPGWKGVGSRSSSLGGERPPWGLLRAGLRVPEARLRPRMQAHLPGHPRPTWARTLTPVHHARAETRPAPHANMPAGLCGLDVGAREPDGPSHQKWPGIPPGVPPGAAPQEGCWAHILPHSQGPSIKLPLHPLAPTLH